MSWLLNAVPDQLVLGRPGTLSFQVTCTGEKSAKPNQPGDEAGYKEI
jgi:hypothetical protein